jgi:hypothetical protein
MTDQDKQADLTGRLASPGWRLVTGEKDGAAVTGTLEQTLRASHDRKMNGEAPGLIEDMETTLELDLIAIEKLWRYLGLPV